jgi:hypothetical protein
MGRTSFGKHAREQAKREKAAAKREDRRQRAENQPAAEESTPPPNVSTEDLLARIAALHEQFEAGTISYDDFEATKADLMAQLPVD